MHRGGDRQTAEEKKHHQQQNLNWKIDDEHIFKVKRRL
jgi:hypothetical protein